VTKIFIIAQIPDDLDQSFLQHVRDFDAHPGCHFEIMIEAPKLSMAEAIERLRLEPSLTFTKIFERERE
jgi:hypothetical protein